ncbi:MAG: hypothetical protein LBB88_05225 [Planctomycetaceae bacterium]|nr:hypothetical protein [Planctomycetaceae bacterium]
MNGYNNFLGGLRGHWGRWGHWGRFGWKSGISDSCYAVGNLSLKNNPRSGRQPPTQVGDLSPKGRVGVSRR